MSFSYGAETDIGFLLTVPISIILLFVRDVINYDLGTVFCWVNLSVGLFLFYHGFYREHKQKQIIKKSLGGAQ